MSSMFLRRAPTPEKQRQEDRRGALDTSGSMSGSGMHANRQTCSIISLEGFHGVSGRDLKGFAGGSGGFRYSALIHAVQFYAGKCVKSDA